MPRDKKCFECGGSGGTDNWICRTCHGSGVFPSSFLDSFIVFLCYLASFGFALLILLVLIADKLGIIHYDG